MGRRGIAVASAEQEDEPLQIAAQVLDPVGGVAHELFQGSGQAARVVGQPLAEELQHFGQFGSVGSVEPYFRYGFTAFRGGRRRPCNGRSPGDGTTAVSGRTNRSVRGGLATGTQVPAGMGTTRSSCAPQYLASPSKSA